MFQLSRTVHRRSLKRGLVLNFVEFCFILELIYSSDFHEGRQYFMLMLVLNFAF